MPAKKSKGKSSLEKWADPSIIRNCEHRGLLLSPVQCDNKATSNFQRLP